MAGLPVETFPIQALVGMISDEVEILRTLGHSDEAIATTLQAKAAIPITAAEITDNYASPELRHADRGGQPD